MARSELNEAIAYAHSGAAVQVGTVAVTHRDGSPATVYADADSGDVITQPLPIVMGEVTGWLEDGSYTLTVGGLNFSTERYLEVVNGANFVAIEGRLTAVEEAIADGLGSGEDLFIGDTLDPEAAGKYMWVQTGLGDGTDLTIWIEDGTP